MRREYIELQISDLQAELDSLNTDRDFYERSNLAEDDTNYDDLLQEISSIEGSIQALEEEL